MYNIHQHCEFESAVKVGWLTINNLPVWEVIIILDCEDDSVHQTFWVVGEAPETAHLI